MTKQNPWYNMEQMNNEKNSWDPKSGQNILPWEKMWTKGWGSAAQFCSLCVRLGCTSCCQAGTEGGQQARQQTRVTCFSAPTETCLVPLIHECLRFVFSTLLETKTSCSLCSLFHVKLMSCCRDSVFKGFRAVYSIHISGPQHFENWEAEAYMTLMFPLDMVLHWQNALTSAACST